MSSKEEKLAAARRKLREFQGKQRESAAKKKGVIPHSINTNFKDLTGQTSSQSPSSCTSESSQTSSYYEYIPEKDESKIEKKLTDFSAKNYNSLNIANLPPAVLLMSSQDDSENSTPNSTYSEKSDPGNSITNSIDENTFEKFPPKVNESPKNHVNGLFSAEGMTYGKTDSLTTSETGDSDNVKLEIDKFFKDTEATNKEVQNNKNVGNSSSVQDSIINPAADEPKDFFWTAFNSQMKANETKAENKDMSQLSVSHLVQENTNLTEVLKRTQEILKYKTGEEQNLSQAISFLQQRVKDLEECIFIAENKIQSLKARNEELMKRKDVDNNMLEEIKQKYESKVEEYSELKQKLELKTKECEHLTTQLKETQSQLSSSLIKIQQLSMGESLALNMRVSELQNENASLGKKIQELQKSLHNLNSEKEESNLSFQTYAQQCNAQIKSLSLEVRRLTKECQLLAKSNKALEKNLSDLEVEKRELELAIENSDLKPFADEISELKRQNKILEVRLKDKVKDIEALKAVNKDKLYEISQLLDIVEEMKSENLRLMDDRETKSRNEKLLAAMESDKVAAARAVSQNQKLKEQIIELEKAFIKMSHEKLKLTDELAHEKHVKKEIELRLQKLESSKCSDHDHRKSSCTVTNESSDVEELKKIIRQLEEDKTELISRLMSNNASKAADGNKDATVQTPDAEFKPSDYEDIEMLKQTSNQMAEKLKKAMNDVATLDEEKENLEHIIMQLQSETETIGEYISLYQNQRMLLNKRSKEKDDQLLQLSKDKDELMTKLITFNNLVITLLAEKGMESKETTDVNAARSQGERHSEDTVEKIQNLISEIQSTNLIKPQSVSFEHCPCCSGRLITI